MRRLSLLLLAPLASAVPTPASATPICQYVGVVTPSGEQEVVHPCAGYGDEVSCLGVEQGPAAIRVVVVACHPAP